MLFMSEIASTPISMPDSTDGSIVSILALMAYVLLSTLFYMIPTMIAFDRRHTAKAAILIINACVGWTCIGWVACLAWAFSQPNHKRPSATL